MADNPQVVQRETLPHELAHHQTRENDDHPQRAQEERDAQKNQRNAPSGRREGCFYFLGRFSHGAILAETPPAVPHLSRRPP